MNQTNNQRASLGKGLAVFAWLVAFQASLFCWPVTTRAIELEAKLRRPIAVVPLKSGLLVANQRSRTLSLIQPAKTKTGSQRQVAAEYSLGFGVTHIAAHPGAADVFALDESSHALYAITLAGKKTPKLTRLSSVSQHPTKLIVLKDPPRVVVSSTWSRELTVVDFDEQFLTVRTTRKVALEFAPREMLELAANEILVGDAFGGMIAAVDIKQGRVKEQRELPVHNIRGLSSFAKGREILVSHQLVDSSMWADRENVHWGLLMANSLRGIRVKGLFDKSKNPMDTSWLDAQGLVGDAAGDPGELLVDSKGRIAVALSGVNQVMVDGRSFRRRVSVGRRPIALSVSADELFIVNQLDDSISIIDLTSGDVTQTVSLGPQPKLSDAQRGERLFFSARLSLSGWMSCHSCHTDGHTSGRLADTLGDGDYGAAKRVPSLLGVAETGPWGWTGSASSLQAQVEKSVRTTMHGRPLNQQNARDLVAFLKGLPSAPKLDDRPQGELIARGRALFAKNGCADCHAGPNYTTPATYDVDVKDASGNREFNPPSLLGLRHRNSFFHDGRFAKVEDVLRIAKHQLKADLSDEQIADLVAFLKSL